MANLDITNIDNGSFIKGDEEARDELLTFGATATYLPGTVLARDSVSNKLVPFVVGGSTNNNGIPKAVLIGTAARTGAGDVAVRALVAGEVNKKRLIVAATGDDSTLTNAHLDQLRGVGIIPVDYAQLSKLDNQ